ncbi:hypothetical protein ACLB1R_33795 [Escherichia coli]
MEQTKEAVDDEHWWWRQVDPNRRSIHAAVPRPNWCGENRAL